MEQCLSFCVFTIAFVVLQCNALTCRSEGGPKENDLKSVYMSCLKKQERNFSDTRGYQDDQDWKEPRSQFNRRPQWNRDMRDRDDGMEDRDDRMDDRMRSREEKTSSRDRYDRMNSKYDKNNNRDDRMSSDDRMDGRQYMDRNPMTKNDGYGREQSNSRYDFPQSDSFDTDMPRYNGYHSTQPSRRFKRSKRTEMNSGQRSQYNPNSKRSSANEATYRDDDRNSSNSSNDMDNKACALHCFLEELEMTGEDGMPDRYLVTHAITKDVKNEDLKDFLQESIEECFQILENENAEEKCQFSKNLMMCLSEKGRSNCDDWKDDLKF